MEIKPLTAQIDVVIDNEPLNEKIIELKNQIKELESEKSELQKQLETSQEENTELENRIKNLDAQILDLQTELQNLQDDLDNLNGEIVTDKSKYALETKNLIADAIKNKGWTITPQTTFRSYASEIDKFQIKEAGDKNTLYLNNFDERYDVDYSFYNNPIRIWGTPQITSEKSIYGTKSLYLDGNSALIINTPHFQPWGINYTFEFWWYPVEYSTTGRYCLYSQDIQHRFGTSTREFWSMAEINNNRMGKEFFQGATSSATSFTSMPLSLKLNQWNHFVITRDDTDFSYGYKFMCNGGQWGFNKAPSTSGYNQLVPENSLPGPFTLFCFRWHNDTAARPMKGYINGLRISNCARYPGYNTYDVPYEPFSP